MYSHATRFEMTLAFLNNPTALGVLLLVVVVLFGGKNIPELMKGLGQGVREFKRGMEHEDEATSQTRRDAQEEEARMRVRIEQEVRARMEAENNAEQNSARKQASETRKQASP